MVQRRIVVAMSGGVDSSVSAHQLVEQGYDVVGLFMRTQTAASAGPTDKERTTNQSSDASCRFLDDSDARHVAERLGIELHTLDFDNQFRRVKDYFVDEYLNARTPNPCVVCNAWVKFGALWHYAQSIGAELIATGHYARIVAGPQAAELHRGVDPAKDQSYFLSRLPRERLAQVRFPVGELCKTQVRQIAQTCDLGAHNKSESQEVCFIPDGDYQQFIRQYRPDVREPGGEIVDHLGKVLGTHSGLSRFTIGQRKGLGVAVGEPRYVLSLEPKTRRVVIGPRHLLEKRELVAEGVHWLLPEPPAEPLRGEVQIRYLHRAAAATVQPLPGERAQVVFDDAQSAITPGQAAVFYNGTRVLGGGWIC